MPRILWPLFPRHCAVLTAFRQVIIHCSLQTKISKKAVLRQGDRMYDAVVKFDAYRNLQPHREDNNSHV